MSITPEEVLRVAELAHLELTEDEMRTYRRQLDGILAYIDKLRELDVSAIEPMAQILSGAAPGEPDSLRPDSLREDVVRPNSSGPEILRQAPDASPPWFRVPRVISR
jgi:aspartyl-tRNA(Asn)/glutamyl-tRNA(Gln) amidotransferase subunit C